MSKISLNTAAGKKLFNEVLTDSGKLPFTFRYDGKVYRGLEGLNTVRKNHREKDGRRVILTADVDDTLRVSFNAYINREFGQVEYTVYFENRGKQPSKVLTDVYCLDMWFEGEKPVLRGNMGDNEHRYCAYDHDLTESDKYFLSTNGRSTHIVFPYFDLVHGKGGTMLALGWAGTWEALFSAIGDHTHVRARTNITLNAVLLPREKLRSGLVVMLPYKTRTYSNATNLWREWFMKYNLPKANAAGESLKPLSTAGFAGDTGLPNSDGSISERYFTWKPTLDKLIKEDLVFDFRWFDAGWYPDPYGNTVETDWWSTVGCWEIDKVKWPGDSFAESNRACHAAGMKVLTWFEPERVTHVDGLVKNYGYKEEWSIGKGDSRTNNLGNEACLKWTLNRITTMMDVNEVDMYREDNNSDPAYAWPTNDRDESAKLGLPRSGVTENKCINGHYRLWDGIIDFCGKHGKCTFVDSCAGGGGRNDIESMRRGFPLMRSDFDRTTTSMRLSQTTTLCRWLPYHGSCTKETAWQLDPSTGKGSSTYVTRASFLPVYNTYESFVHNPELDYDLMRRNYNEWKSVNRLLVKDMYVLTPWHHEQDREGWSAFAYDDPEEGSSVLLAFRMEDCEIAEVRFPLEFARKDASYRLAWADSGETVEMSGAELRKGVTVKLPEKKSSALIRITRI